jgi:hypothetical protein
MTHPDPATCSSGRTRAVVGALGRPCVTVIAIRNRLRLGSGVKLGRMVALAEHVSGTAPRDGTVYRGYFERSEPRGAMFKAVRWEHRRGWVDLEDHEVGGGWRLTAWSPD